MHAVGAMQEAKRRGASILGLAETQITAASIPAAAGLARQWGWHLVPLPRRPERRGGLAILVNAE
eukprot:1713548-Alexandrium_andersonii.AAC.1